MSDTFKIMVPDDASETWILGYQCSVVLQTNNNGACDDYVSEGYYQSSATNTTGEDLANADVLPGDQVSLSKNMTFLNGYSIEGTLSVPIAPTDPSGMDVRMSVRNSNNLSVNFETAVDVPQGATEVDYSITVSLDADADWAVNYLCQPLSSPIDCTNFVSQGFYDSGTATTMAVESFSQAELLPGGSSHVGIDFSMLTGELITGKLVLIDGMAPVGGISFVVNATEISGIGGGFSASTVIAEGESEANFSINVGTNTSRQLRLSFDCQQSITPICLELSDTRYFDNTTQTTVDIAGDADPIPGGVATMNVNLEVESSALSVDSGFCWTLRNISICL